MKESDDHGAARETDPGTSHAAAMSVDPTPLQQIIIDALRTARTGLTTHEISDITGIGYWTITPRMKPMREKRLVYDTGLRRLTLETRRKSIVWQLISILKEELDRLIEET